MPYYYILNSIESILKCFKYRQVSVKCLSNRRQTSVKLKEVGLNLVNRGMKVESFAALIRLREILEEKKWVLDVRPGEEEEKKMISTI